MLLHQFPSPVLCFFFFHLLQQTRTLKPPVVDIDVSAHCRLTREEVPGSLGTAFVLIANNDGPLSVLATINLSAKNAVVSMQGEELERGPDVELSQLKCICPRRKRKVKEDDLSSCCGWWCPFSLHSWKILLRVTFLDPTKSLKWSFKAHLSFDSSPKGVDTSFLYTVPIKNGVVSQGNCCGTHMGESDSLFMLNRVFTFGNKQGLQSRYAYDFSTDNGTEVFAARGGTVLSAVDHNYTNGEEPNKLVIAHDDESVALYGHLAQNGTLVKVCLFSVSISFSRLYVAGWGSCERRTIDCVDWEQWFELWTTSPLSCGRVHRQFRMGRS
jgi:hypothetical protein